MVIGRHVAVVGPALRRQHAVGGAGEPALQIFDKRAAIDGVGQRLPHALIFQNGIARVECQVGQHGAGRAQDGKIRIALESQHHVGGESVDRDIGAALAKFERARGGVGHDDEADIRETRFLTPVFVVALEDDIFVRLRADEAEGTGADGVAAHLVAAAVGHDADGAVGKIPQQGRERLFEMEDDGVVVRRVDVIDEAIDG